MKFLIVVDMQNDFVRGLLGSEAAQKIIPNIQKKIEEYKTLGENGYVIFTKDTHYEDYLNTYEGKHLPIAHCQNGTWGHEIVDEFLPYVNYPNNIVFKNTFGAKPHEGNWICYFDSITHNFANPDIKEIESIELCGVCTDICVVSNGLILRAQCDGYPIIVDSSCCAGTSVEAHEAALTVMRSCQIEVI